MLWAKKESTDQLEPTVRSVWANLHWKFPIQWITTEMTAFHPQIKNLKKLIDYRYDHSITLLAGFQVIAFQNVSIQITNNSNSATRSTKEGNSKLTI